MKAPFLVWRIEWQGTQQPSSFSLTLLNVAFDDLRRDITSRAYVVAARPKMLLSTHLLELGELFAQIA